MSGLSNSPLADVYDLIRSAPPVDLDDAGSRASSPSRLGRLDYLSGWIAACQRKDVPSIDKPTIALFAGSHGIETYGVSASQNGATERRVNALREGRLVTNGLSAQVGGAVRVFELALEVPSGDISTEPALSEQECAATIAFGMEAATDEPDCLALGLMGIGGGTAAAAVAAGLYGGDIEYWVRAGDGVPENVNQARADVLKRALETHRGHLTDPLEVLRRLGGRELAACVGAILAARHQGLPVVLDGFATAVAAAVLHAIDPDAIDHVIAGQITDRPAHKAILERINKPPLLDLELQLGEGVGAALAVSLLKAACAAFTSQGTPHPGDELRIN